MGRHPVLEEVGNVTLRFNIFLNRLYRAYHKNAVMKLTNAEVDMLAEDDALYHRAISEIEDESDRQREP